VKFRKLPPMLTVRQELSKAGHQYFTFITKKGCEFLSHYLAGRMKAGEVLTPASPLTAPDVMKGAIRPFETAWWDTPVGSAFLKGLSGSSFIPGGLIVDVLKGRVDEWTLRKGYLRYMPESPGRRMLGFYHMRPMGAT
jgi:hypothetical protein